MPSAQPDVTGRWPAHQGINTDFHTVVALMISNGLVGLSGGLYAQYQGAADVNMGRGAIVIGLAAVIIGEVLFGKLCARKTFCFCIYHVFRDRRRNHLLYCNEYRIRAETAV